jgi:hypothetical protein
VLAPVVPARVPGCPGSSTGNRETMQAVLALLGALGGFQLRHVCGNVTRGRYSYLYAVKQSSRKNGDCS